MTVALRCSRFVWRKGVTSDLPAQGFRPEPGLAGLKVRAYEGPKPGFSFSKPWTGGRHKFCTIFLNL
jgi:hypothetical protein